MVYIVLPVVGVPYILKTTEKDELTIIQNIVGGRVELISSKTFIIHPMFTKEKQEWAVIHNLLAGVHSDTLKCKIYVNENGRRECCPNMATIVLDKMLNEPDGSRQPPIMGMIAIKISVKELKKVEHIKCILKEKGLEEEVEEEVEE